MRLLDYETLLEKAFACDPTAPEGPLVGEVETSPNNIQDLEREELAEMSLKVGRRAMETLLRRNKTRGVYATENFTKDNFFSQLK
jgi:hypothetical protein